MHEATSETQKIRPQKVALSRQNILFQIALLKIESVDSQDSDVCTPDKLLHFWSVCECAHCIGGKNRIFNVFAEGLHEAFFFFLRADSRI